MIQYAKEQTSQKTVADIVCPKCQRSLVGYAIIDEGRDRYKRQLRSYMGWCHHCQIGFEVIQFKVGDKWHIHKHRYYAAITTVGKALPLSDWQVVNELPQPPAVVIGPGDDYDMPFNPKVADLLEKLRNALKSTSQVAEGLLKYLRGEE